MNLVYRDDLFPRESYLPVLRTNHDPGYVRRHPAETRAKERFTGSDVRCATSRASSRMRGFMT